MRAGLGLTTALVLSVLASGCLMDDRLVSTSAREAPPGAPTAAGPGTYSLVIRVLHEPGGPAIEGANVAVSWGYPRSAANDELRYERDRVEAIALRTARDGRAEARVPPNTPITVSAWAPGHTEEWVRDVPSGAAGAAGAIEIPLYLDHILYETKGTLGPAGSSLHKLGQGAFSWTPLDPEWGQTPEARAGYVARLSTVRVKLQWENGANGGGDLGIGIGNERARPDIVEDQSNQALPGPYTEEIFLDFRTIYDQGWRDSGEVFVGAGTGSLYVGPLGLPYALEVEATFHGDLEREVPVPGPGAALAFVAITGVAVAIRRRYG